MQELGYNYRITDIQCALGRSQLKKLPKFIERRAEIVARYNEAFADIPWLTTPKLSPWLSPNPPSVSWHLYTVLIDYEAIGISRSKVMAELRANGVGSQVLYIPVHLQPYYRKTYDYKPEKCRVVTDYYTRALSLPLYPAMTNKDVEAVVSAVKCLMNA